MNGDQLLGLVAGVAVGILGTLGAVIAAWIAAARREP